jgi:tRNA-specific 2-thiouridylase
MEQKKVVVAMSGGVDSSLAAALLQERGYRVIGVTMNIFDLPENYCRAENLRSCCGWKAVEDAIRVASILGISHYVADLKEEFEEKVIADFCEQYATGRTPNPCIRCNQYVKFEYLMARAEKLGADFLATGHHARVEYDSRIRRFLLKKGKDPEKDQSYFLYPLAQKQMSRILFPIGDFTKREVRKRAQEMGLPVAQRTESQEICFIPEGDYAVFIKERVPHAFQPGPIIDTEGRTLGQHKGIAHFTIGQRRGMAIAAAHPLYVTEIQYDKNTIVVGPNEILFTRLFLANQVHSISMDKISQTLTVKARIRYKHKETKAVIRPFGKNKIMGEFEKPQRAITPGQSVVFYDGDIVVGGGIIEKAAYNALELQT